MANPYQQAAAIPRRGKYGRPLFPFIQQPIVYDGGNEDIYASRQQPPGLLPANISCLFGFIPAEAPHVVNPVTRMFFILLLLHLIDLIVNR